MTPMQVISSSTLVASRAMGLDARVGTIEKGKDADLVILSADPTKDVANFRKVKYVLRAGVVRTIEELSAMAQYSSAQCSALGAQMGGGLSTAHSAASSEH